MQVQCGCTEGRRINGIQIRPYIATHTTGEHSSRRMFHRLACSSRSAFRYAPPTHPRRFSRSAIDMARNLKRTRMHIPDLDLPEVAEPESFDLSSESGTSDSEEAFLSSLREMSQLPSFSRDKEDVATLIKELEESGRSVYCASLLCILRKRKLCSRQTSSSN